MKKDRYTKDKYKAIIALIVMAIVIPLLFAFGVVDKVVDEIEAAETQKNMPLAPSQKVLEELSKNEEYQTLQKKSEELEIKIEKLRKSGLD